MLKKKRIVLATTGQPSTNPRLVKEANALIEAGYQVKVYYLHWAKWATETDKELLQSIKWDYQLIGGSPEKDKKNFFFNKLKTKLYQKLASYSNQSLEQYRCRAYNNLLSALKKDKANHYIAHNLGALAPIAKAAQYHKTTFSFDAEDFHRGQYPFKSREQEIDIFLENKYLPKTKFITTASPLITQHYQALYPKLKFTTINNVFSQTEFTGQISKNVKEPLKLVWFSQTIGKQRGLENILEASNLINDFNVEINLFGHYNTETQYTFNTLLKNKKHSLHFYKPLAPTALNLKLYQFDIGIASETGRDTNNDIALSNKIFSYIQAGLAVLASKTAAQELLLKEHATIGQLVDLNNPQEIVSILSKWHTNRESLNKCKEQSFELAKTLNWETEQIKFIQLINDII